MSYDFDSVSPARDTCSHVWNTLSHHGISGPDAISYGVAETKFPLAPEIASALRRCVDDGYFGYIRDSGYSQVVCEFMKKRHDWSPDVDWVIQTYGVVSAIAMSIRAFTDEGDGVIIQTPVYNPFFEEIERNNRLVFDNRLLRGKTGYAIDFEDFERKAADPRVKLFVLCSPHNPVGRVWTREELKRLSDICCKNGVIVVSDEIHNDLAFMRKHTMFSAVSTEAEQNCVVCTAPSKTFNIPGLVTSNIFIPNNKLRERFSAESKRSMGEFLNVVGIAAGTAAYTEGCAWLDELTAYIAENASYLRSQLRERLPQVWMPEMEGTYLAWIDMSYLGLDDSELEKFFIHKAGLAVNMGSRYGEAGKGFVRVNIGCPRRYVGIFVDKLCKAINEL